MKIWIIAGVLIIMIVTAAAAVTLLLLASQDEKQEKKSASGHWKVEFWNIAKGYRVNLEFQGNIILGRANLFTTGGYPDPEQQDITVSRQHCMLYEQDGALAIWNLSAVNPADLNGHRINAPVYLNPGDRLKLGHSVFLITAMEFI